MANPAIRAQPVQHGDLGGALGRRGSVMISSVPDGMVGKVVADMTRGAGTRVVFVARDGQRLAEVERTIRFFDPPLPMVNFPAWDCLPYDRVSPHPAIVARRM